MSKKREDIAMAMAAKDGHDWEKLPEMYQNAYLHNADEDIKARAVIAEVASEIASPTSCKVCKDQAYIGGSPCPECNPVGLPAEQVHPGAVTVAVVGNVKKPDIDPRLVNLCDTCSREYPACDSPNVEYGDGTGNDNIIVCAIYKPATTNSPDQQRLDNIEAAKKAIEAKGKEAAAEKVRATRPLKPNEYRCGKCSKPGKTVIHMVKRNGKGIGTKHLEFKI